MEREDKETLKNTTETKPKKNQFHIISESIFKIDLVLFQQSSRKGSESEGTRGSFQVSQVQSGLALRTTCLKDAAWVRQGLQYGYWEKGQKPHWPWYFQSKTYQTVPIFSIRMTRLHCGHKLFLIAQQLRDVILSLIFLHWLNLKNVNLFKCSLLTVLLYWILI